MALLDNILDCRPQLPERAIVTGNSATSILYRWDPTNEHKPLLPDNIAKEMGNSSASVAARGMKRAEIALFIMWLEEYLSQSLISA
mmetsp:Transcript_9057/g.17083  ORF Transcript_9057/g.17083 Transcript_9057/m.17083 type:complete len:86 (+) Transcript_9057:480-737(+)